MRPIAWVAIAVVLADGLACRHAAQAPKKIAITTSSAEATADFLKGRALFDQMRVDEARPLFDQALAKDPQFALAHLYRAQSSLGAEDYFAHMKAAVAAADGASDGEQLWIHAEAAGSEGKSSERGQLLDRLAAAFPDDERAHQLLGSYHYGIRKYDAAAAEFRKASQLAPAFAPTYNMLGYCLRELDQPQEAEAAFRKYIELVPNEPNPHDSLGELLLQQGKFAESIESYRKALELDPKFASARRGIAAALMYRNQPKDAMAEIQNAFEQAGDDVQREQALFDLAVCHTLEGEFAPALQVLSRAGSSAEQRADRIAAGRFAFGRADVLLFTGKVREAAAEYQRAQDLMQQSSAPDAAKAMFATSRHGDLALIAAARKDFATAGKEANALLTAAETGGDPNRLRYAHEVLGRVALSQKNFDGAVTHFTQADTRSPWVAFHLAKAYEGRKDAENARVWYRKAAGANVLPGLRYAMIRKQAQHAAGA